MRSVDVKFSIKTKLPVNIYLFRAPDALYAVLYISHHHEDVNGELVEIHKADTENYKFDFHSLTSRKRGVEWLAEQRVQFVDVQEGWPLVWDADEKVWYYDPLELHMAENEVAAYDAAFKYLISLASEDLND